MKIFFKPLLFLIVIISIPAMIALFHPGLPITHDGQDHVARIANFYKNLQEGVLVPRWAENLNWGYGHPILMFLYPLPSYLASFFRAVGFSFVDSAKIVFGLGFILSGITMYFWMKSMTGEYAAIAASILYMFAPYRFVDLYVRGAIGEHLAFVFPPLIAYFLLKMSKKRSYSVLVGGAISISGFILAHNAISLMFLPLLSVYSLYLWRESKYERNLLIEYLLMFCLGLSLAAFFWIPAFFEGRYTLRDIVTKNGYQSRFVTFDQLVHGEWNYGNEFSFEVGFIQWLIIIVSIVVLLIPLKKRYQLKLLHVGLLLSFFAAVFVMLPQSNFLWKTITTLQKFQFPWRFLSVAVFAAASLGGLLFRFIPRQYRFAACVILLAATIFLSKNFWLARAYLVKPESFYAGIYSSTTDTGESSPIWSVRFMEQRPKAPLEIILGNGTVTVGKRTSTNHSYTITANGTVRVRENTLYFPGWNIYVDGQKTPIEFQDPKNRGLMTFVVPNGTHAVQISFTETKLRWFADILSLVSIGILLAYPFTIYKILWRRFQ